MADKKQIDSDYQYQQIVSERTIWLVKPLAIVCFVMWCLHPATSRPEVVERNILAGFLMGALFGIFVYRKVLRHYLIDRRNETLERRNRVPEEYYFGKIVDVLDETGD